MIDLHNINERSALFYHGARRWRYEVLNDDDDIIASTSVTPWSGTFVLSSADTWLRNIQGIGFTIVSDAAGDTGKGFDVIIVGEDQFGNVITETLSSTVNGTTPRVIQSTYCYRRVTGVTMTNFTSTIAGTVSAKMGYVLTTGLRIPSWAMTPNRSWFLRAVCGTPAGAHPTTQPPLVDVPKQNLTLVGASTAGPYYVYLDPQYKNYL
jgi:hypothetical protein